MATSEEKHKVGEQEKPKNQINLNPIRRLFEAPQRHIEAYVTNGQVVADLGCGPGYYTLALAECVGPEGRVYAVDLDEKAIRALEEKADKRGYRNIEAHASSASDLSFIKDGSVDFVLANGVLCSMADHRQSAVNEIRRILKPRGQAYLSLGAPPPLGFVGRRSGRKYLKGSESSEGVVSSKGGRWCPQNNGRHMPADYVSKESIPGGNTERASPLGDGTWRRSGVMRTSTH